MVNASIKMKDFFGSYTLTDSPTLYMSYMIEHDPFLLSRVGIEQESKVFITAILCYVCTKIHFSS